MTLKSLLLPLRPAYHSLRLFYYHLRHPGPCLELALSRIRLAIAVVTKPVDSELPFDIDQLKRLVEFSPIGVIHVGGHHGQEIPLYKYLKLKRINVFEPQLDLANGLHNKYIRCPNITIHPFGLGSKDEERPMYLETNDSPNYSASSSFLKPLLHLKDYSYVKFNEEATGSFSLKRLDSLNIKDCDLLVLDTQGFEMEVLIGAEETLAFVKYIICEYWQNQSYENVPNKDDIINFLEARGFRLRLQSYNGSFGDFFFSKSL
jgi:FkbM family methyltransferase